MQSIQRQRKLPVAVIIVALAILAGMVFIGYRLYNQYQNNDQIKKTESSRSANNDATPAPTIESKSDLDEANATLNETDIDSSNANDEAVLDSELSQF